MKKFLVIVAVCLVVFSCKESNNEENTVVAEKNEETQNTENLLNKHIFRSETFPISLNFPNKWEIMHDTNLSMIHVLSPTDPKDNFQEMVNIVVGGTNGKDLDTFFEGNLAMISGMFEELEQTEEPSYQTINAVQFKKVRYNYLFEGLPLTAQLYVTIQGENSYIINCSALQNTFDDYQEEFVSIVHSIVLN